jgi:hypothetical protein
VAGWTDAAGRRDGCEPGACAGIQDALAMLQRCQLDQPFRILPVPLAPGIVPGSLVECRSDRSNLLSHLLASLWA